ncbi:MAG: glycoside hydrolase family 10 protein, partial [Phycisphaerae bacterium]
MTSISKTPSAAVFCFSFGGLAIALLAAGALISGCRSSDKSMDSTSMARAQPRPLPSPVKAVWVARFHYYHPADICTIIRNCAALGFNTILWQVRGSGTVAYPSRIEPWSAEYGHQDPGFDPLQIAVEEAHRRGLRIEAWVNVMPGWRGPKAPPIKNQLWHTRPEWFLRDAAGNRQPLGRFYLILNPGLPEVRRYVTSVVGEIVTSYDVDGIHLDYVRYPDVLPFSPGLR